MIVIFYSPEMDGKTETVRQILQNVSSIITVEVYHSIDSLRSRITRPLGDVVLTLIRPSMPSDLESLMDMKDRFEMLDVIVMAAGENSDVDRGIHELRPRFVFNVDDNPEVIGLVLKKMMERKKANPSYGPLREARGQVFR